MPDIEIGELPAPPSLGDTVPKNGQWIVDRDGDDALHVEFYKHPVDGDDHVRIIIPGDDRTKPDFLATPHYQMRFARQWAIYKGQLDEFDGQTRIETVSWVDPGNVHEMKRWNIHTVEQLAGMADSAIDAANMLGLLNFRARAQQHLTEHQKSTAYDELKQENAGLATQLQAMQEQMNTLTAARESAEEMMKDPIGKPQKRGPGRPRKDQSGTP